MKTWRWLAWYLGLSEVAVLAKHEVRAVLRDHHVFQVECDHVRKLDRALCSCSLVDLGWHPSVGQAIESWIDHVLAVAGSRP